VRPRHRVREASIHHRLIEHGPQAALSYRPVAAFRERCLFRLCRPSVSRCFFPIPGRIPALLLRRHWLRNGQCTVIEKYAPWNGIFAVIWAALSGGGRAFYFRARLHSTSHRHPVPSAKTEGDATRMMNSVARVRGRATRPCWCGGGGLWVAFPQPMGDHAALYLPCHLLSSRRCLYSAASLRVPMGRGDQQEYWNSPSGAGSMLAGFARASPRLSCPGIRFENGQFAVGPFDWARPSRCYVGLLLGGGLCALGRDLAGD